MKNYLNIFVLASVIWGEALLTQARPFEAVGVLRKPDETTDSVISVYGHFAPHTFPKHRHGNFTSPKYSHGSIILPRAGGGDHPSGDDPHGGGDGTGGDSGGAQGSNGAQGSSGAQGSHGADPSGGNNDGSDSGNEAGNSQGGNPSEAPSGDESVGTTESGKSEIVTDPNPGPNQGPDPFELKIEDLQNDIRDQKAKYAPDVDWVLWSGFDDQNWIDSFIANNPYTKVQKTRYMADVLTPNMVAKYRTPFKNAGKEWKFWTYMSQAFAREITGNIYVILPKGKPLNKPYSDGKGSNFWSMELPELSRNPQVSKITRVDRGDDKKLTGGYYTIWNSAWIGRYQSYGEIGNPDVPVQQPEGEDIMSPAIIPSS